MTEADILAVDAASVLAVVWCVCWTVFLYWLADHIWGDRDDQP